MRTNTEATVELWQEQAIHNLQAAEDFKLELADARREICELEKQITSERALADRLAALFQRNRDLYGGQQVDPQCGCCDCEYLGPIDDALNAWKEARSECR